MIERGSIRVPRIDCYLRYLLAIAQAEVRPRAAGVGGLVDAVTDGQIGPLQSFAAADVDRVRIGRRDGNRADRSRRLIVEDRPPRPTGIGRLPHAAVHHADIERVRLRRNAGGGFRAPATERADVAPRELAEDRRIDRDRERRLAAKRK